MNSDPRETFRRMECRSKYQAPTPKRQVTLGPWFWFGVALVGAYGFVVYIVNPVLDLIFGKGH